MRTQPELGMEVVGWAGAMGNGPMTREALGASLMDQIRKHEVERIIVALENRRGTMPVRELLELRLSGVKIEDATAIMEKLSGKIEVDELYPSWLIFSEGFRLSPTFILVRRLLSLVLSFICLVVVSPLLPLISLLIKLTSPGPVLYRQKRVGRNGSVFTCYKFRTMRADAEADIGPTWAGDDDPRVTRVGRWLRLTRLDEVPQLWNVLRGDMGFVGPRPERPEFVAWLNREIPYYHLRHIIRPGITGWAQIRYQYGASLEQSKEKLKYDLYYIKRLSLSLDLMIVLESLKIILLGRGAR
jgi:sugar transferase (PEP-CTERM system associated)